MFERSRTLDQVDAALWAAIQQEDRRQEEHIELIASENYASPAVMQAQGTQLTNKYAEGYPGKRYYGGCEYVDIVEQLAIDRLKQLFGAEAANVQPNSGSQANQAVYMAVLKPGDTVLGMSLAEGGHLTHGASVNASGKLYNFVSYGLNDKEELDYDQLEQLAEKAVNSAIFPGIQGGPLIHVIAGKAVAFLEALSPEFKTYAAQIVRNADVLARRLTERGLRIVSGRTESHVMLVDLRPKQLTGKVAEALLGQAHITVNKNAIPNDPEKPFVTSGIRLGTPAITTRGFREEETRLTADLIADLLDHPEDEAVIAQVRGRVHELTSRLPVYR